MPRIPKPPTELGLPHQAERVLVLARPFSQDLLARACLRCGFSTPQKSTLFGTIGAQVYKTNAPKAFGSLGEEIRVEVRSPLEIVLISESKLPSVPFLDWRRNAKNLDKLAMALTTMV